MFYKFEKDTLTYRNVTQKLLLGACITCILMMILSLVIYNRKINNIRYISQETKAIIIKENYDFSEVKLKEYILDLNIHYPHIVMAQAKIESGYFKSNIFKENNNLFGMRQAKARPTTSSIADNNYGFYNNWKESVLDYALFQATIIKSIKNEDEYFQYLRQYYAEDTTYVSKIKKLIKKY